MLSALAVVALATVVAVAALLVVRCLATLLRLDLSLRLCALCSDILSSLLALGLIVARTAALVTLVTLVLVVEAGDAILLAAVCWLLDSCIATLANERLGLLASAVEGDNLSYAADG